MCAGVKACTSCAKKNKMAKRKKTGRRRRRTSTGFKPTTALMEGGKIVLGATASSMIVEKLPVIQNQSQTVKGLAQIALGVISSKSLLKGAKYKSINTGMIVGGVNTLIQPYIQGVSGGTTGTGFSLTPYSGSTRFPRVSGGYRNPVGKRAVRVQAL